MINIEYLTVQELQKKLKLGKTNTYKLISQKNFPKIKIGRKILIPENELDEYMNNHIKTTINLSS